MALRFTATDVKQIGKGLWSFEMPPHHLRHFGTTPHAIGPHSVLLLHAPEYDELSGQLHFDVDQATPINVGTTSSVIGIHGGNTISIEEDLETKSLSKPANLGPGDREFLRLAKTELSERMAEVAEKLLLAVRYRSAGDLKRGQSRNFSETPDNFWYVIVQPRVNELSITVRGSVTHFAPVASIEIKDDRGNTRFKVRGEDDIPAALAVIFHALRKR